MISSPDIPKLIFIEDKFQNDETNWWVPNQPAMFALIRSAGMKISAKPGWNTFVCEPVNAISKKTLDRCVFPEL
jgi:tRNA (mo5U34)-methyltransferase